MPDGRRSWEPYPLETKREASSCSPTGSGRPRPPGASTSGPRNPCAGGPPSSAALTGSTRGPICEPFRASGWLWSPARLRNRRSDGCLVSISPIEDSHIDEVLPRFTRQASPRPAAANRRPAEQARKAEALDFHRNAALDSNRPVPGLARSGETSQDARLGKRCGDRKRPKRNIAGRIAQRTRLLRQTGANTRPQDSDSLCGDAHGSEEPASVNPAVKLRNPKQNQPTLLHC